MYKRLLPATLLALALLSCTDTPQEQPQENQAAKGPLFTLLPSDSTGVSFNNALPIIEQVNILNYEYFYNGGGVAIGDINNDGLADLYFTANLAPNKLYLNKGGMHFEDITSKTGVEGKTSWATGVTMVDINQDGWLDIYVSRSGKFPGEESRANELFINQGDGTFKDEAKAYGLDDSGYATQAAFFDYDKDGDLDVYLLNHNTESLQGKAMAPLMAQRSPLVGDKLYRNDNGRYTDVSQEAGLRANPLGYGLGVGIGDLNQDGWPDIYVSNDFVEQDYLYLNNQQGGFVESIKSMTKHTSNFSMGNDLADMNNDGLTDIIVADMVAEDNYRQKTNMASMSTEQFYQAVNMGFHYQYMINTLQLNNGNGSFSEIGQMAGVSNTDWSWATLMTDFDLDGHKDLFISNGFRLEHSNKDFVNQRKAMGEQYDLSDPEQRMQYIRTLLPLLPSGKVSNYMFRNNGDLTFSKVSQDWGFDIPSWSGGAAYGDLDNDGDLDLVVNNIDMEAFIYRNNARENNSNHSLRLTFEGPAGNKQGIGTSVEITTAAGIQSYQHYLSRGYQSSMQPGLLIGLGDAKKVEQLTVTWPDGRQEVLTSLEADQTLNLSHTKASAPKEEQAAPDPLFQNITAETNLILRHRENPFNDLSREVLLPHFMSQWGPALAVADVNGDGLVDIYAGGAKSQPGVLVHQTAAGKFQLSRSQPWTAMQEGEDVDAAFIDVDNDGDQDLYIVRGGNELNEGHTFLQDLLYLNNGQGNFSRAKNWLPEMKSSGGRIIPGDYDGDGDIDLFVTGRQKPGNYPLPGRSYLLRNDGNKYTDITETLAPSLARIGMVTDAAWTDVDGDGKTDLALTGEWMPLTIAYNRSDGFEIQTVEGTDGWWFALRAEDVDGDGDEDLIAGNLGLNYKYQASQEEPFEIYADDFDGNGKLDIVLGYYNSGERYPLRGRQCSSEQIPDLKKKFPTYDDFGKATLDQVYGPALENATHYVAKTFATTLFINEGGKFTAHPLPNEAQLSSVNDILAEDFDGDGKLDLLMAGNLFVSEPETPRNDAGMGIFLKGDGKGGFTWVPLPESGFFAGGDVRHLVRYQLASGQDAVLVANNNHLVQLFTRKKD